METSRRKRACVKSRGRVNEVGASARIVHQAWFNLSRSAGLAKEVAEEESDGIMALSDCTPTEPRTD